MKRRFQLVHGIGRASELEKSTDPSSQDKIEQTVKGEPEATTMFKFSNYMYVCWIDSGTFGSVSGVFCFDYAVPCQYNAETQWHSVPLIFDARTGNSCVFAFNAFQMVYNFYSERTIIHASERTIICSK